MRLYLKKEEEGYNIIKMSKYCSALARKNLEIPRSEQYTFQLEEVDVNAYSLKDVLQKR